MGWEDFGLPIALGLVVAMIAICWFGSKPMEEDPISEARKSRSE